MTKIHFIQQTPILTLTVVDDDVEAVVDNVRLAKYLFDDDITYESVESLLNRAMGNNPRKTLKEMINKKGTLRNSMFPTIDIEVE